MKQNLVIAKMSVLLKILIIILGLNLSSCGVKTSGMLVGQDVKTPLQQWSPRSVDTNNLPSGLVEKISHDWAQDSGSGNPLVNPISTDGKPKDALSLDESYRTIRVRVFPHLSVPGGDSYQVNVNPNEVTLKNDKGLRVLVHSTQELVASGTNITINFSESKISLNGKSFTATDLRIMPDLPFDSLTEVLDVKYRFRDAKGKDQLVSPSYRGAFLITMTNVRGPEKQVRIWSVVNFINLEDYINAVVPAEIWSTSPEEAIRAQAIAARSYALANMGQAREKKVPNEFDVEATTASQAYFGFNYENARVNKILENNKGLVATYKGQIILAVYSANSGGQTCSAAECWGKKVDYLQSVKDHPEVRKNGVLRRFQITGNAIQSYLAKNKTVVFGVTEKVTGLESHQLSESGRVDSLMLKTSTRNVLLAPGKSKQLVLAFGSGSLMLDITKGDAQHAVKIESYGSGHGVGLSQWGAMLMAKEGRSAEQIIKLYYSGIELTRLLKK